MIQVVLIVLVLFFAYFVLSPFFEDTYRKRKAYENEDHRNLLMKKEEILEAIHDLEYDYKLNKITLADYQQMKENLTRQAVEVMKELDVVEKKMKEDAAHAENRTARSRKKVHS